MRAFTVCVDYADILSVCVERNIRHFDEYTVCTSGTDKDTIALCKSFESRGVRCYETEIFWENRSVFNKWAALEECLDAFGRHGQICLIDADIVLPESLNGFSPASDCIYTPIRRIVGKNTRIPDEKEWSTLPSVKAMIDGRYQQEGWAGYTQIFNSSSQFVPRPPWHKTHLGHAGCSDTWFEECWPDEKHQRPPFEVLHIGMPFENWVGIRNAPDKKSQQQQAVIGKAVKR